MKCQTMFENLYIWTIKSCSFLLRLSSDLNRLGECFVFSTFLFSLEKIVTL